VTDGPGAAAGARIRALRSARGLSLSTLAARAGIGKGSLSELEAGRRNPTLETLYAVAGPLGVPLVALLGEGPGAVAADGALEAVLLHAQHADDATTEVYLVRVRAGATRRSPAHATGVREQLVVLEGSCRLEYAGHRVELPTGGHAAWPADVPHAYTATSDVDLQAIDVIVTPRPGAERAGRGLPG
jgi:transcriptional regulator with XRE-family HTH domain